MPTWIVIAADDLNDYNVAEMMTALRQSALADEQADPYTTIMHDRANYIRNRISGRVQLSATAYSVPPELKTTAAWLIIESMSVRLAAAIELTRDQKDMISRAYKDLDIAGTEDLPVTLADDAEAAEVQQAGGIRTVTKRRERPTSHSMDGL